jgi:uncharacterized membrane protein YfcA
MDNVDIELLVALLFVTFIAGVAGALLGLGGGFIVIPVLTLALKIPIHVAIGASIIGVIATSSAAATVYVQKELVNVRLAMVLETATTLGAIAGAFLAVYLNPQMVSIVFALFLLYAAFQMALQPERSYIASKKDEMRGKYYDKARGCDVDYCVEHLERGLLASFIAGNFSGLLGVGGGLIKVPAMYLWMNVPMKVATATSNFMIGVTAAASAYIYYTHGFIDPIVTAATTIGIFTGATIGSRVVFYIGGRTLQRGFAIVIAIISIVMLANGLGVVSW